MIDVRRQQQAVGSVEPLGIRRLTPWFDVACLQVPRLADACDSTEFLAEKNVGPEYSLASPGSDDLLPERRSGDATVGHRRLDFVCLGHALENGDCGIRIPICLPDE